MSDEHVEPMAIDAGTARGGPRLEVRSFVLGRDEVYAEALGRTVWHVAGEALEPPVHGISEREHLRLAERPAVDLEARRRIAGDPGQVAVLRARRADPLITDTGVECILW